MRLGRQVGDKTKELYVICQRFDLILEKNKLRQGNKKIQYSSHDYLSDGRMNRKVSKSVN